MQIPSSRTCWRSGPHRPVWAVIAKSTKISSPRTLSNVPKICYSNIWFTSSPSVAVRDDDSQGTSSRAGHVWSVRTGPPRVAGDLSVDVPSVVTAGFRPRLRALTLTDLGNGVYSSAWVGRLVADRPRACGTAFSTLYPRGRVVETGLQRPTTISVCWCVSRPSMSRSVRSGDGDAYAIHDVGPPLRWVWPRHRFLVSELSSRCGLIRLCAPDSNHRCRSERSSMGSNVAPHSDRPFRRLRGARPGRSGRSGGATGHPRRARYTP